MRVKTIRQKARIILNSDDATKTITRNDIIPVVYSPVIFDGSTATVVDTTNNVIHISDHRLQTGQQFIFTGTTTGTGLASGGNVFVIFDTENTIKLATSTANASAGTAIDITAAGSGTQTLKSDITFSGHLDTVVSADRNLIAISDVVNVFNTGDYVQYTTSGTAIDGLTNNQYYYYVKIAGDGFQLANTFADATADVPVVVDIKGVGSNTTYHRVQRVITFDGTSSPVVDIVNEQINIPAHGFKTGDKVLYECNRYGYTSGTAIGGLLNNFYYWVIVLDPDSIKLATTSANALASPPVSLNITSVGTGRHHSFTKVFTSELIPVCTNYKFKLPNLPLNLNDKCRLAVHSFDYVKNYPVGSKRIGAVYSKQLSFVDTYSTQALYKGVPLLTHSFAESFHYQNNDVENSLLSLPNNMMNILQNGLDIFVDSRKNNFSNQDIQGNIDEDAFNMVLCIYEIDEDEYINHDITKAANLPNVRYSAVN